MGQKQSFGLPTARSAIVARQGNDKLGKYPRLGLDIDPAAMLLDDDVVKGPFVD
jgi:hypothetical protein